MLSLKKSGVIRRTFRTYRHLKRYRQILSIFIKYGFEDFLEILNIDQYLELGLKILTRKSPQKVDSFSRSERVRMAIEELGPTFIKLGQVLSTRQDLVPEDLIKELVKLQDEVPPFEYSQVVETIENELGSHPDELFLFFEDVPIASASIGQVHKAQLLDGREVAIKVQRPAIKELMETDIEIMLHLSELMERHIEEVAIHKPMEIIEEFSRTLFREIDYQIEASNNERMTRLFTGDTTMYIPKVYRDMSTKRVLTMEFIDGIKISEIGRLEMAGLDRKLITKRGADIVLKQVFNHGFFHADPHPGNIFVLPNNVICLLDFGMVCTVNRAMREDFVDLLDSLIHLDDEKTTKMLLKLTIWEEKPDMDRLNKDVAEFIGQHLYKSIKDIDFESAITQLLEMGLNHRLRTKPDIFLMLKAFSTIESVTLMLDPDFDMLTHCVPFFERVKLSRFMPQRLAGEVFKFSGETYNFLKYFPAEVLEVTRLFKNNQLSLNLELPALETVMLSVDRISNRIVFAIIIAALIIGSAIIVFAKTPPVVFGISVIGLAGFCFAAALGFWVIISMLKKHKL